MISGRFLTEESLSPDDRENISMGMALKGAATGKQWAHQRDIHGPALKLRD